MNKEGPTIDDPEAVCNTNPTMFARIAIELALDREFDYRIPASLSDDVKLGSYVKVPFGRSSRTGFVTAITESSDVDPKKMKDILEIIGNRPLLKPGVLEMCRFMAAYYVAPFEHAVRTVLPGAVRRPDAKAKTVRMVAAVKGPDDPALAGLQKRAPRRHAVMQVLFDQGRIPVAEAARVAGTTSTTVKKMEEQGWVMIDDESVHRDPAAHITILPTLPLTLNPQQQDALDQVIEAIDGKEPRSLLLFGVTGSGKTEVYLQAIAEVRKRGQRAIVLVPEIALTPQTMERFRGRFGDEVAVLHSNLSDGERHDEWHRVLSGEAAIIVGARSALFAPVDNLGLIVVDEEHEPSYKQDQSPRYHARDMAVLRAQFDQCPVLLGSATPSIESYQNTINHKYRAVHLAQRVDDRAMPSVRVVDLRQEQEREGRPVLFSRDLIEAMEIRLNQHEQIILFLNRRGYATSHLCVACGYVCECEECGVAMTYHRRIDYLRCHLCGQGMEIPSSCPECKKPEFKVAGIGTERVEDIIRKFFPHANVRRADSDTMTTRRSHEDLMRQFRGGKIDILVGTQMIAKGLDFPNVTLVGVINADRTLHMPDFRAAERTFQLLTQVAGRAGRGEIAGEVIVQTYTPEHPAIQAAKQQDYKAFFDYELEFRRELHYPPFSRLAAVTVRGKDEALVRESTETFHKHWLERLGDAEGVWLNDACPAAIEKIGGVYRYQIVGRALQIGTLTRPLRTLFTTYQWPSGVRAAVDVDPTNLM